MDGLGDHRLSGDVGHEELHALMGGREEMRHVDAVEPAGGNGRLGDAAVALLVGDEVVEVGVQRTLPATVVALVAQAFQGAHDVGEKVGLAGGGGSHDSQADDGGLAEEAMGVEQVG